MKIMCTIILIMFSFSCNAELITNNLKKESNPNVSVCNSEVRKFHSKIYNEDITIKIYLPMGYEKSDTTFKKYPELYKESQKVYPVLYLLDSDVYFDMATSIARLLHWENKTAGLIIVGVSYGLEKWWENRFRDYLPYSWPGKPSVREAHKFLEMNKSELIPYVESNFRVDTNHRILFGHSAGAMFVLYSIFSNPDLFTDYIPADIWIKYLNKFYFDMENEYFNKNNNLKANVYFIRSELFEIDKREDWNQFINILDSRNYKDFKYHKTIINNEDHLSSVPIALTKSLQWYFSKNLDDL